MGVFGNIRKSSRKGATNTSRTIRDRVYLEPMEPRLLLSAELAHWIGGSGNWSDPNNWDIGVVPDNDGATTYRVVLDVAGTPIISLDQDVTIDSLTNAESLVLGDVSATVSQQTTNSGLIEIGVGTGQLSLSGTITDTGGILANFGTLNLTSATLTVDGITAQVTADASATLSSVNLYAMNGGVVSLLGAASFTSAGGGNTIQATGAGSRIDLSALTDFAGGSSGNTQIKALDQGEVDLAGDVHGRTVWTLDSTGGVIDASAVTSLTDTTVNVSGAALEFSTAASLVRVNLSASEGGDILFPAAISYTGNNSANTTIQASGVGSRIDLSSLETLAGGGYYYNSISGGHYYWTYINALSGGEVDLAGALSANNGGYGNSITLDPDSVLDVTGITKLGTTTLTVTGAHDLTFSATTEVTGSNLTAGQDVNLSFPVALTLVTTNLSASDGGDIFFPVATSYTGNDYANTTIEASGVGSHIDLSSLQALAGGGYYYNSISGGHSYWTYINALAGGKVDLAGAISGRGHGSYLTLDGGSSIDASAVTSLTDTTVNVSGAALEFSTAASLVRVNLSASEGGDILFPAAISYTGNNSANTTIQASGVGSRIDLSSLETLAGGGYYYNSISGGHYYWTYINALSGGEVDLAGALSANNGGYGNSITLDPDSVLDVTGITKLGTTTLTVTGAHDLTFSATTEVTGSNLTAGQDVNLSFPVALTLVTTNLSASDGGDIFFPVATSYTGNDYANTTIEASGVGSHIDLSSLQALAGGGYYYNSISGGHSYWTYINALAGGKVDLAGAISGRGHGSYLTLDGGSSIDASAVTSLTDTTVNVSGAALEFSTAASLVRVNLSASEGGDILFPAAISYTGNNSANTTIQASGVGSRIDLSSLETLAGGGYYYNSISGGHYYWTYINALSGGEVDLAGALSANNGGYGNSITLDPDSVLDVTGITKLGTTTLTVTGAHDLTFSATTEVTGSNLTAGQDVNLSFPVALTLVTTNLSASDGGDIFFPVATSYTGNDYANTTIEASGVGSHIDLSSLQALAGGGYYYNSISGGHSYWTYINALAGGKVDLAGAISGRGHGSYLTLDGGSSIDASAVTSLTDTTVNVSGAALEFSTAASLVRVNLSASEGGDILFPAAISYTGNNSANTTIQASGVGSRIDLSSLETLAGGGYYYNSISGGHYYWTYINALSGGEVDLAGALSANNGGRGNNITLDGISSVVDMAAVTQVSRTTLTAANGAVWTFSASWHPTWGTGITLTTSGTGSQFINRGTINVSGASVAINTDAFVNEGVLSSQSGGVFDFNGSFQNNALGILAGATNGTFTISGDLLGSTANADQYAPLAVVRFDGTGTAIDPQQLEVMGSDQGAVPAGFTDNFVYSTLSLSNNTYLQLVDLSDNTPGVDPEALYVNSLIVPAGTTLDLNSLALYARAAQIGGTIVGGTFVQIPDSGPIELASPTPGAISVAGELDEWSFFARGGRSVTVAVDTGSSAVLTPRLNWAYVELVDATGSVLASASSTAAGQTVTLTDVAIPSDGTYRVRIKAPVGHLTVTDNYLVSIWDVTADVSALLLNKQVTGTIENPYSVDRWTFSAQANTQVRFDLVNRANSNIVFDLIGPAGWEGFTDLAADSELITLPDAGTYTLTAHGTGGLPGGAYAFKMQKTQVTDLALGTFETGTFTGSGQAELYRIDVTTAGPLKIVLDDDAGNNVNELYLKFGASPTRGDYDYRFKVPAGADQEILVPMAYAGKWYALVYSNTTRTTSAYDISAVANGVFLTSVTPDHYAVDATATLTVNGAGFDATTVLSLMAFNGTVIAPASSTVNSPSRMTATFSLAGLAPGMYSVVASEPGGVTDTLTDGFTVTGAGAGQLQTHLVLPSVLGRHGTATLYVDYANTGNEAIPAPLLVLESGDPDGSDRPFLTLDRSRLVAGFWTSALPAGFSHSVQFLAGGEASPGVLQPGESGRMAVYYAGLQQPWNFSDSRVEFNVGVLSTTNTTAVDWNSLKAQMQPDYVQADAWDAIWGNFTSQVGGTWGSYLAALDENAVFLDALGAPTSDITKLLAFELRQAEGLNPIRYLGASTEAAMPAPGPDVVFSMAFAQPISRRFELGPLGRGWADNWQLSLTTESDGTVRITDMTGTPRIFQPDSRHAGQYFAAPTDHGTLVSLGGGVLKLTETDGTAYLFRTDGKLDYVEDTNGNRITASYTGDLLTGLMHSSGQTLTIAYNGTGRIESVTDSDGRQALYTYDAANEHLLSVQDYDGRVTGYSYVTTPGAAQHALSEIAYADGSHRYYTYDVQGRLASTYRDGGAETITFSYDTAGTVTATDALGNSSEFRFDDWGTILKSTNALGNSVLLSLDEERNLESVTDPAGFISLFEYDSKGNLTVFTDAMGYSTGFTYTADFNRLDLLTDANGNVTNYDYDSQGNLTRITYADGSHEGWGYDGLGQATEWTNRRGTPVGFTYNTDGQITQQTYDDGTHVDYVYDARGNLTSATDQTGTTTFTYDANDYLTRIDYPGAGGRWLEFTYDAGGRRDSSTDQLGHVLNYEYDAAGRLSRITDESAAQVVLYEYDVTGRIAKKTLGNGVYTTYDYDAAGQLLHLVNHKADAAVLSRFDYTYDSRGRRTGMDTLDGTWAYSYDDIGQLTHAVFTSTNLSIPDQDLQYVYDPMGNRIRTIENGVTTEYTTNNLNQYTQVGDTAYVFDADGNLISQTSPTVTTLYSYDDENRLIAVQQGADAWSYTYDAFGQRVSTTENGITTSYIIDPIGLGNVVGEYDAAGNLTAGYDYGFGLLSRTAGGASAWYTFDAIGNTSALTNAVGDVINTYGYEPFGETLYQTGAISNPFQFVGELGITAESVGLDFMRARFFDEGIGRFTQCDPIGLLGDYSNTYRYVFNSPSHFFDPEGLKGYRIIFEIPYIGSAPSINAGAKKVAEVGFHGLHKVFTALEFYELGKSALSGECGEFFKASGQLLGSIVGSSIGTTVGSLVPFVGNTIGGLGGHFIGRSAGGLAGEYFGKYCPWSREPPEAPEPGTENGGNGSSGAAGGYDPNEKVGPTGYGDSGFILPTIAMPYRIDFENESSATAPAQIVTITDQLDANLDWNSFALTEIGFGDELITVPTGAQHFETTVPVRYNDQDFEVQIEIGIHLATGLITANFYSIDPLTGLPPDVLTGFLPPEDGTGRGMGYFSYTIRPVAGLPTGTEIRNIALISFDGQPWIATNQVDPHNPSLGTDPAREALNTIDAGAPNSAVQALSAIRTNPNILVQWGGTDDAGGSGIGSFDIYVAMDGGSYSLWQDDITGASAIFAGAAGHSYAFYSIARDNVGTTETAPTVADTTTAVVDGLAVTAIMPDASGISVRLTHPVDTGVLNLYDTESGGLGAADITLVGATSGAVAGSLVLDADLAGFSFVRTGGVLAPDTYTLTLRSATNGFVDSLGTLLDGDDDGTPGGDFSTGFTVTDPLSPVLSLPDIVRGPGQPADIPATQIGLPLRLSDVAGLTDLSLTLVYDPALLTLTGASLADGLPAGSTVTLDTTIAGQAVLNLTVPTALAAGARDLVVLSAEIPANAPYKAQAVLSLEDVSVNGGTQTVLPDDALQVVAYLGDTTGNGKYSSLDAQRISRVVVGYDTGFAAFSSTDPVLIGDVTGNGALSSLDATRVKQEVVGYDRPEIPPLPGAGSAPLMAATTNATVTSLDASVSKLDTATPSMESTVTQPVASDTPALQDLGAVLVSANPPTSFGVATFEFSIGGISLNTGVDKTAGSQPSFASTSIDTETAMPGGSKTAGQSGSVVLTHSSEDESSTAANPTDATASVAVASTDEGTNQAGKQVDQSSLKLRIERLQQRAQAVQTERAELRERLAARIDWSEQFEHFSLDRVPGGAWQRDFVTEYQALEPKLALSDLDIKVSRPAA